MIKGQILKFKKIKTNAELKKELMMMIYIVVMILIILIINPLGLKLMTIRVML